MTIFIIYFQTIFILFLAVLFFYQRHASGKHQEQLMKVKDKKMKAVPDKKLNFFGINNRKDFRVTLNNIDCLIEFLEFENSNLNKLKNKKFNGYLENISISGLKLVCNYDLPMKQGIIIKTNFNIKDQEFCLKGEIKRKEEHNNKNLVAYGVVFIDHSYEDEQEISKVLNKIIIEQKIS